MKFKLEGLKQVKAKMTSMEKMFKKKVNTQIAGAAMRTAAIAKSRLQPHSNDDAELAADIASVRQSINFSVDTANMSSTVYAGNVGDDDMAAYLEFGTGKYAARYTGGLPNEFRTLAMTFWVNGQGTLQEHPYLVPSYLEESKRLDRKLRKLKLGSQKG